MLMKYITTKTIGMPGTNDLEYGVMFLCWHDAFIISLSTDDQIFSPFSVLFDSPLLHMISTSSIFSPYLHGGSPSQCWPGWLTSLGTQKRCHALQPPQPPPTVAGRGPAGSEAQWLSGWAEAASWGRTCAAAWPRSPAAVHGSERPNDPAGPVLSFSLLQVSD